jgi:hypothetical protein
VEKERGGRFGGNLPPSGANMGGRCTANWLNQLAKILFLFLSPKWRLNGKTQFHKFGFSVQNQSEFWHYLESQHLEDNDVC